VEDGGRNATLDLGGEDTHTHRYEATARWPELRCEWKSGRLDQGVVDEDVFITRWTVTGDAASDWCGTDGSDSGSGSALPLTGALLAG
jgi:hypothetical protein